MTSTMFRGTALAVLALVAAPVALAAGTAPAGNTAVKDKSARELRQRYDEYLLARQRLDAAERRGVTPAPAQADAAAR